MRPRQIRLLVRIVVQLALCIRGSQASVVPAPGELPQDDRGEILRLHRRRLHCGRPKGGDFAQNDDRSGWPLR
jgi:hypothetical protein